MPKDVIDDIDVEEFDEAQFQRLVADRNNKKIMSLMNAIIGYFENNLKDNAIAQALKGNSDSIKKFVEAVREIKPEVKVDNAHIEKLASNILESQAALNQTMSTILESLDKKKEWKHEAKKDTYGNFTITSTQVK